jgi:hypothetical protein
MRQVPKFLIIGNGRLARHLAHYFSLLKIKSVVQWDRSQPVPRLVELATGSSHILLAIKDDAIEPFIDAHLTDVAVCEHVKALNAGFAGMQANLSTQTVREMQGAMKFFIEHHGDKRANLKPIAHVSKAIDALPAAGTVGMRKLSEKIEVLKKGLRKNIKIHFSGSLVTRKAYGAHPLMTFGPELYSLEKYLGIPFVVDEKAPLFSDLLPGLHNPNVRLSEKQKAKYHALCVMAGNFSCILWQKLFDSLGEEFDIPPHTADMYLRQQTDNLLTNYKGALTGPLARGDSTTIERNIDALGGDPFKKIYEAFVEAYPSIKQQPEKRVRERKAS